MALLGCGVFSNQWTEMVGWWVSILAAKSRKIFHFQETPKEVNNNNTNV